MGRPLWFVNLLKAAFPGRHLGADLSRAPWLGRLIEKGLFEGDDLYYLPRDRVIEVDEPLDAPAATALPSRVAEHFVERAGTHWLMNGCICRQASNCRDYPIDLGCLFLGEAALGINPALGRRVTRDEALEHLKRCRQANLVHLVGRNKLDTVWLGVGPGSRLMTICNCCPCCCLWRVLPRVSDRIRNGVNRLPGVAVTVTDECDGCEICATDLCFVDAMYMRDGRAVVGEGCVGCGLCASTCPQGAIKVTLDDEASIENTIKRISSSFDRL